MESYRNRDTNVEVEISKYLDEKFYPSINAKINRFKNKEDQLLGKDILFTYLDLTDAIVDEKAKTHYINKGIPTFAFELSFIHDGKVIPGWLIDSKKVTDHYILLDVWAKKNWNIVKEDITKIEVYILNRIVLLNYLLDHGFSTKLLLEKSKQIRESKISGQIEKGSHQGFYFFFTINLKEKPINIIVRKDIIRKLSYKYFIYPNS